MDRNLRQLLKELLHRQKGVDAAFLFGSEASGTSRPDSDVDIALLFNPNYVPETMSLFSLRGECEDLLGKDVDLVLLNTADPFVGTQVYKTGKQLFIENRKNYSEYLIRLFNEYVEMREMRRADEIRLLKGNLYDRSRRSHSEDK